MQAHVSIHWAKRGENVNISSDGGWVPWMVCVFACGCLGGLCAKLLESCAEHVQRAMFEFVNVRVSSVTSEIVQRTMLSSGSEQ